MNSKQQKPMRKDRRVEFIEKWFTRSSESADPFDEFFCLWIAIIVAAQKYRTFEGIGARDDRDAKKVLDYFKGNESKVVAVLDAHQANMKQLAERKGTKHSNPIVDTGSPELQGKFQDLSSHYLEGKELANERLVECVAELLNKIRNNLFHGKKLYDDAEDIKLLELVNPILRNTLATCENLSK